VIFYIHIQTYTQCILRIGRLERAVGWGLEGGVGVEREIGEGGIGGEVEGLGLEGEEGYR